MTRIQLAQLAGVSVSTVFKAFSGSKEVSAAKVRLLYYFTQHAKVSDVISYGRLQDAWGGSVPCVVIGKSEVCDSINLSWRASIEAALDTFWKTDIGRLRSLVKKIRLRNAMLFLECMRRRGIEAPSEYMASVVRS